MKDGCTHLAHKAEHAVDMDTGAIVGVTIQGADQGDTTTITETLTAAAEDLEAVATVTDGQTAVIDEIIADKGVPQQSGARGSGGARPADLHRGTGSRPTQMEEERRPRATQCMRIAGASVARVAWLCCDDGASTSNDRTPISMRPAGCVARICEAIRTS